MASPNVPTLLATSPLAAMRSAPTTTRSTSSPAINDAASPSATTVHGIPRRSSSQAVSRAPWRTGRVSSTHTVGARPASCAARMTPTAVPYPTHASAPALQCVRTRAACGTTDDAVAADGLVHGDVLLRDRHGLGDRIRGRQRTAHAPRQVRSRRPRGDQLLCGRIEIVASYRRQAPRPSRPRRRALARRAPPCVTISSHSSSTEIASTITSSPGNRRWSMRRTRSPAHSIVGGITLRILASTRAFYRAG